ncbi:hypothetical protein FOMPIDRAFT_1023806 [Fomitopsis schrenkii]|uniref:Uncharacterized protein n=1 Tax=Fomitopsis schrenkii TaxID=2126942 RepID=S8FQ43_FOMSC|nr:hypothetical protein FOMPIDRAFT_1023806 [Fomitopsis schrenkii]
MFATYYSHSMMHAAPADASISDYAAPNATQKARLTIKVPPKDTLVQARPKVRLRAQRVTFAPAPEPSAATTIAALAEFEVPLSAPVPQQISVAPVSPPRVYGRPRRVPGSARHGRRAVLTSPSGSSTSPANRTETFESITCTPPLTSTSFEVGHQRGSDALRMCVHRNRRNSA